MYRTTRTSEWSCPETQGAENCGERRMDTFWSLLLPGHCYSVTAQWCAMGKLSLKKGKLHLLATRSREEWQHMHFPTEGTAVSGRAFGYPQQMVVFGATASFGQKVQELADKTKLLQDISCHASAPESLKTAQRLHWLPEVRQPW